MTGIFDAHSVFHGCALSEGAYRGLGDVSVSVSIDAGAMSPQAWTSDSCGIGRPVYYPPDDRAAMPAAVASEMYKWDYMVVNRPEDDRCNVVGYASDRSGLYASLIAKWNSLTVSQRALADKDATGAWVNWTPGDVGPSAADEARAAAGMQLGAQLAAQTAARQQSVASAASAASALAAAADAAKVAAISQTAVDRAVASTLAKDAAAKVKASDLAAAAAKAADRSSAAAAAAAKGSASSTGLILGGVAAAAVLGGVLYFTLGKKKGSATPNRRSSFRSNSNISEFIRAGDKVTIVNRFGQRQTGRAVMRGPYGWVLNMGGRHGTPGIATEDNTVGVKPARGRKS
jgi:hypothetical protein